MTYPVRAVNVSHDIPARPDEVFQFVADTRNDPEWCPNVSSVSQVFGDGVEDGARFDFHQTVTARGRRLESDVEVEILSLGERSIEWRVDDRYQIRHITLTVEPHGEGTRIRQRTQAAFKKDPGLARWLYPFLARRTLRDQFTRLAHRFAR